MSSVGNTIRFEVEALDSDGQPLSATTYRLRVVRGSDGVEELSLAEISTGVYEAFVTPAEGQAGVWTWEWLFTDAAGHARIENGTFFVSPRVVPP